MERWADLLIKKVQKDSKGRIQKVLVGIDTIDKVCGEVELTKNQVIAILKDGVQIRTTYFVGKNWQMGATVSYYIENSGEEYLRTNSNQTAKDNLDNLPTF